MKFFAISYILLSIILLLLPPAFCVSSSDRHEGSTSARFYSQYLNKGYEKKLHSASERYICEVSQASPLLIDVKAASWDLVVRKERNWCVQENRYGSKCTRMTNYGTASVAICGGFGSKMACVEVRDRVMEMSRACAMNVGGKVLLGGKFMFDGGYLSIYHS